MRDIRNLLSGSVHIERIVFACDSTHVVRKPAYREEQRTRYYLGAFSKDRFLLVEIPSPESADQPVDLLKLPFPTLLARTSDANFYYNGPLLTPQPRATANSNLENAMRVRLHPLRECLQLGLVEVKPGSFRWDGDHFIAEFTDEMKEREPTYSIRFGRPGEVVPESVKKKFLANLLNPRKRRTARAKLIVERSDHISLAGAAETPALPKPAPGSVEERILAHYADKHRDRMARGIIGQMVRDVWGAVKKIHYDTGIGIPCRIELEYATTDDLPVPFLYRIKRFFDTPKSEPSHPSHQITIYAARVSKTPLDDATFIPWRYLKEGTYVRGKALRDGRSALASIKDHKLLRDLLARRT